jgi:hypothetical protein
VHEFVDREVPSYGCQQTLDRCFVTVDVKKSTNDLGGANRVDSLNINLDKFGEPVLVEVRELGHGQSRNDHKQ